MTTPFDTIKSWLPYIKEDQSREGIRAAIEAIEADHFTAADMADAQAKSFRDGVASVTAGQEPVGYLHPQARQRLENGETVAFRKTPYAGEPTLAVYVGVAPVAQQPQEIEVQCPVCNHKFYEWPNDKQPQAEAVPVVDRVYEAAKRLVDHADFQLGGVLSAKSKARDIPSNAASKVKARHLASLRDALAKTPHQAEAVPPPGYALVPIDVLEAASESLGSFVSDLGWTDADMQAMDNLDAILAQQKGQP